MIRNDEIDELAEEMRRRRGDDRPAPERHARRRAERAAGPDDPRRQPFVLFLGPQCAAAAGVPSMDHIARLVLDLVARDEEMSSAYPQRGADPAAAPGQESLRAFYGLIGELTKTSGDKIYRMLLKLNAKLPVPLFYQDLALLIKAGYFERILTTNIDTLLEQALDIAGLQAGYNYRVTSLGMTPRGADGPPDSAPDWDDSARQTHIVKLFGDLSQEQINIAPWEIDGALRSHRRYLKSELEGDIVMVGYDFESKSINEWLGFGGPRREQLWWVAEDWNPQGEFPVESWAGQLRRITGRVGRPEEFFGQLKLRLQRRSAVESAARYGAGAARRKGPPAVEKFDEPDAPISQGASPQFEGGGEAAPTRADGPDAAPAPADGVSGADAPPAPEDAVPPEDVLLVEELRRNIRRSQAVLFSLEQTSAPGDLPESVRTQIIYQKQQIAEMEDKIRSLASSRRAVTETLEAIVRDAEAALASAASAGAPPADADAVASAAGRRIDGTAAAFLRRQYEIVRDEYARPAPNQFVIAAAVGGALLMAERLSVELGPEVVGPGRVRRLAAFSPSVAGRGGV